MSTPCGADVRERLGHPSIDADGHTVEFAPALDHYLRDSGTSGGFAAMFAQTRATALAGVATLDESTQDKLLGANAAQLHSTSPRGRIPVLSVTEPFDRWKQAKGT